jgi:hypothetical protein
MEKAVAGVKQSTDAVNNLGRQTSATGINIDSMMRRMERPIMGMAFSGLAVQLTDIGSKGESSTRMLEQGFHAAGMALMYINPALGMMAVGILAIYDATNKYLEAKPAEEFKKQAEAVLEHATATKTAYEALKNMSGITKGALEDAKEQAAAAQKAADALINQAKAGANTYPILKELAEQVAKTKAEEVGLTAETSKGTIALKALGDLIRLNIPGVVQIGKAWFDTKNALKQATEAQNELLGVTQVVQPAIVASTKMSDDAQKSYAKDMFQIYEIDIPEAMKKAREAAEKEQEKMAKTADKYSKLIADNWKMQDGKLIYSTQELSKKVVEATSEMIAQQLLMMAIRDMASGNFGLGAAEMAAATVVETLGNAAGTALGAETPTASSSSGINGGTTPSGPGAGAGTNLTIVLQGGNPLSRAFWSSFLNEQNSYVQSANGQVVATHIVTQSGQVVAAG